MTPFHITSHELSLSDYIANGRLGELRKIFGDHNLKSQDCLIQNRR